MGKFIIDYRFSGRGTDTIQADSLEEAQEIADRNAADDDFEPPVDEYDAMRVTVTEMHPVTRSGHEVWTTYVLPSDTRGHASALATTPLFSGAK